MTSAATTDPTTVDDSDDAGGRPVHDEPVRPQRTRTLKRALVYGVLPAIALLLAVAAGYLKWLESTQREAASARVESVGVASDGTVALLSYKSDTVDEELHAAAARLADGPFKDSYLALIRDVVVPGAEQQKISSVARVAAAASVSATPDRAVVLVFVDQDTTTAEQPPTTTTSSVRVTLEKQNGSWRITQFDPV